MARWRLGKVALLTGCYASRLTPRGREGCCLGLGSECEEFARSPPYLRGLSSRLSFLPQSAAMYIKLSGNSKFARLLGPKGND